MIAIVCDYLVFLPSNFLMLQAGSLSDFYENCRELELARNFQFPTLREVSFCV
jgi:hypothetical protein